MQRALQAQVLIRRANWEAGVIEEADWIDPVRLEARVAGVVARNRERLADPVLADAAFRRLVEELSRALGAARSLC